jgi:hypothetical protein
MASVQEQRRGILLLAFASAVLRIYMPGTVVHMESRQYHTVRNWRMRSCVYLGKINQQGRKFSTPFLGEQNHTKSSKVLLMTDASNEPGKSLNKIKCRWLSTTLIRRRGCEIMSVHAIGFETVMGVSREA